MGHEECSVEAKQSHKTTHVICFLHEKQLSGIVVFSLHAVKIKAKIFKGFFFSFFSFFQIFRYKFQWENLNFFHLMGLRTQQRRSGPWLFITDQTVCDILRWPPRDNITQSAIEGTSSLLQFLWIIIACLSYLFLQVLWQCLASNRYKMILLLELNCGYPVSHRFYWILGK